MKFSEDFTKVVGGFIFAWKHRTLKHTVPFGPTNFGFAVAHGLNYRLYQVDESNLMGDEIKQTLSSILESIMSSNQVDKAVEGLEMINKLICNILEKDEEKYKMFKKSNKLIKEKLLSLEPEGIVIQLMQGLGYVDLDEEQMIFDHEANLLKVGRKLLSQTILNKRAKESQVRYQAIKERLDN